MLLSFMLKNFLIVSLLLLWLSGEGRWRYLRTAHFNIGYTDATKHLVDRTAAIAESSFFSLNKYFGKPDFFQKINILLHNIDDIPQGYADSYNYIININVRKIEMLWRNNNDWLAAVLTHELAHILSLRLLLQHSLVYLSTGFNNETGDQLVLNFHTISDRLPLWFIEGIAQMGSRHEGSDYFDPKREMLLRDSVLNNRLLDYKQMCRFEGSGRDRELVYNQGFAFLIYLSRHYKMKSFRKLFRSIQKKGFKKGFKKYYNLTPAAALQKWRNWLKKKYNIFRKTKAKPIITNFCQKAYKAETAIAGNYVIANYRDDFNTFSLYKTNNRLPVRLARHTGQRLVQDPLNKAVLFNRRVYHLIKGGSVYDLYRITARGKKERLTRYKRVTAFASYDNVVYYSHYRNEQTAIIKLTPDGEKKTIYRFNYPVIINNISCIDSQRLVVSIAQKGVYSVYLVKNQYKKNLFPLTAAAVLDAVYKQGKIYFTSFADGTPQIYCRTLNATNWCKLTGCSSGARYPSLKNAAGFKKKLIFARYHNGSFRLHSLPLTALSYSNAHPPSFFTSNHTAYDQPLKRSGAVSSLYKKKRKTVLIAGAPVFTFSLLPYQYTASVRDSSNDVKRTGFDIFTGFNWDIGSPSGNFVLNNYLAANFSILNTSLDKENEITKFFPHFLKYAPSLNISLWDFILKIQSFFTQRLYKYNYLIDQGKYEKGLVRKKFRQLSVELAARLGRYNYSSLSFKHGASSISANWSLPEGWTYPEFNSSAISRQYKYFRESIAGFTFGQYYPYSTKFVPPGLRGSGHSLHLNIACHFATSPDTGYYENYYNSNTCSRFNLNPDTFPSLFAGWEQSFLLFKRRLAISWEGSYKRFFTSQYTNSYHPFYYYEHNHNDCFAGFADSYPVNQTLYSAAAVYFAPFIDLLHNNYNYLIFSLKGEAGLVTHYLYDYNYTKKKFCWQIPASLKLGIKYIFYLRNRRKGALSFSIAWPKVLQQAEIPEPLTADKEPRFYIGISL